MGYRLGIILLAAAACMPAADWNPRSAADYLDHRQAEWSAWPRAQKPNGPCLSCHTGLFYLVARPALRGALHETTAPAPETELLRSVRARSAAREATPAGAVPGTNPPKGLLADQLLATQAVLTPLVLAYDDRPKGKLSPEAEEAFRRMWDLQVHESAAKGA